MNAPGCSATFRTLPAKAALAAVLAVALCRSAALALAAGEPRDCHLLPGGEPARYGASWNGIPVAEAEIRSAQRWQDGKRLCEVEISARTLRGIDLVWRMRDTVLSLFEPESGSPRHFAFSQRENARATDTTALYDAPANQWKVVRRRGSKTMSFSFVSNRTLDPIAAAYTVRGLDLKRGEQVELEVFGGKSRYRLRLEVSDIEPIRVGEATYRALRIVPRLENLDRAGYASRLREATVWVSADEKRIPLRIRSKVFIGSVQIELKNQPGPKTAAAIADSAATRWPR